MVTGPSTVEPPPVNEQDSLALVDLYNSTNGPLWDEGSTWLLGERISTWAGVVVTGAR